MSLANSNWMEKTSHMTQTLLKKTFFHTPEENFEHVLDDDDQEQRDLGLSLASDTFHHPPYVIFLVSLDASIA